VLKQKTADEIPVINIKQSDLALDGHAAALCRREDYERLKEVMDDGATAPATFDEYERRCKASLAQSEAMLGRKITVVTLIPDEFLRFCEKHRLRGRGSLERCLYAVAKAAGKLEDDNFKLVV